MKVQGILIENGAPKKGVIVLLYFEIAKPYLD